MNFEARAVKALLSRLGRRKKDEPEAVPPSVFVPSSLLFREFRRARALNRNVQRASIYNPRLHRRAADAAHRVRALDKYEREQFAQETA